jgi:PAS domain S-box-containing protein
MKMNTALGFFFTGTALIFLHNENQTSGKKIIAQSSALIVIILGGLSLLQYILNINLGIDQIFIKDAGTAAVFDPGRMSVPTALNFCLFGCSFLFYSRNVLRLTIQILVVIVIAISVFALLGYIFNLKELFTLGPATTIALHTSVTFLVASFGFLFTGIIITTRFVIRAGLVFAFTLSILIGSVSYFNNIKQDEAYKWVEHTLQVEETLHQFNTDMTRVQTSERGYALTGDKRYLNNFYDRIELVKIDVNQLTRLISDNRIQQQKLEELKPKVEENLNHLKYVVSQKQKGIETNVIGALKSYKGELIMEEIIRITSQMEGVESGFLNIRRSKSEAASDNTKSVILFGGVLSTMLLVFVFYFLVIENIRRTRAEKIVQESEEKFRNVFENSSTGMSFITLEGKLNGNKEFANMLGYTIEEMKDTNWKGFTHPDDIKQSEKIVASLIAGEQKSGRLQKRYLGKNGDIVWVDISIFLQKDENKNPLYFISTISNITELKTAEQALIEKTEELDRYFSHSLDLLCIADLNGNFRRLNKAWEFTLGYKLEDLEGKSFLEFVHPDDLNSTLAAMADLSKNIEVLNFTNRYRHKDGSYRWIEWKSFPSGHLIYASARDITERIRIDKELTDANRRLQSTNKELEAFSYSVSHDLRAPLRHINGFIELLRKKIIETADESVKRYLDIISKASKKLGTLIDELLAYSRAGRVKIMPKEVNLNELVKEVITELKPQTENRKIVWRIEQLPKVQADYNLIKLVYQNLISNAIKFTRKKEKAIIEITAKQENGKHFLKVKDNGAGFDMTFSDRLFGVFQRLHGEEEFEGSGIGLANVQRIVNMHRGEIRAEGKVNEGAEFVFSIPI